jgi:hypothetical protein
MTKTRKDVKRPFFRLRLYFVYEWRSENGRDFRWLVRFISNAYSDLQYIGLDLDFLYGFVERIKNYSSLRYLRKAIL